MKVLVDTSVWSLALRKKVLSEEEQRVVQELKELILEMRVTIIGPIRQELLSGISDELKFEKLKGKMRAFDDVELTQDDYERAAEISNSCRRHGIQGSHIDFLIFSASINNDMSIFTTDKDFKHYKKYCEIKLHQVRGDL